MYKATKGNCEYCGDVDVYICSTPENGCLCLECHQLVIANCKEAVKVIKAAQKGLQKNSKSSAKKDVLKALDKLLNGCEVGEKRKQEIKKHIGE